MSSNKNENINQHHHRNALGGRRSSLTDLDAEAQAKLIEEHNKAQQEQQMGKSPSFGVEDIDTFGQQPSQIAIGLERLNLASSYPAAENQFTTSSAMKDSLKAASQLTPSQDSDQSMDGEENDKVLHMGEDLDAFRQVDYLWLFNNELKFSERDPPIELDDAKLTLEDFQKMRQCNRRVLTEFCKNIHNWKDKAQEENPKGASSGQFEVIEEYKEGWADECLDEELKSILVVPANGRKVPVDIVSHMEYFYNTLDCSHVTKNPFDAPEQNPVLLFRVPISNGLDTGDVSPCAQSHTRTLMEMHRLIIFPNSMASKSLTKSISKSTESPDVSPSGSAMLQINGQFSHNSVQSFMLLPAKYKWYPNSNILSPKCNRMAISPSPKNIQSSLQRRSSAAVVNNPYSRVSGQYLQPPGQLNLRIVPTHQAENFGQCMDSYHQQHTYASPAPKTVGGGGYIEKKPVSMASGQSAMKGSAPKKHVQVMVKQMTMSEGEEEVEPVQNQHMKKPEANNHLSQNLQPQQQRRMTLFDLPIRDNGRFEALTTSAHNAAKQQAGKMRQSVLVQGVMDFNHEKFV